MRLHLSALDLPTGRPRACSAQCRRRSQRARPVPNTSSGLSGAFWTLSLPVREEAYVDWTNGFVPVPHTCGEESDVGRSPMSGRVSNHFRKWCSFRLVRLPDVTCFFFPGSQRGTPALKERSVVCQGGPESTHPMAERATDLGRMTFRGTKVHGATTSFRGTATKTMACLAFSLPSLTLHLCTMLGRIMKRTIYCTWMNLLKHDRSI